MNKKLLKSFAAAAMSVLAIACAKEQVGPVDGEICEATFDVAVPGGISTKTIADGTTAKELWYQVFDKDGNVIAGLGKTKHESLLSDRQTSVSMQLVKDQTYNIVFWAQSEGQTCYKFDDLSQITVDYAAAKANEESRDAFLAVKNITVNGPINETVEMKRPFAQLNIGTADAAIAAKAGVVIKTSKVEMKGLPNVLNTINGTTDGAVDVTFADNAVPSTEVLSVNGKEYTYLAMNYILAPAEGKEISDVKATFTAEGKNPVSLSAFSVPFQRNYRTNIIGNILTNSADFNVEIDPGFAGDENISPIIVNGVAYQTLDAAVAAAKTGEQTIIALSQDMAGNGVKTIKGQDVVIDLGGHTFDIDGSLVGSTGTETSGFQLLKGSKVTFKNGTLKSKKASLLIQNYSDLTLENVTLDATGGVARYVLSNNHGTVKIIGSSSILAPEGKHAFDVYYWPPAYSDGVNVYVNTTGIIRGAIEYACFNDEAEDACNKKTSLVIENAVLEDSKLETKLMTPNIKIVRSLFADEAAAAAWIPAGYKLITDGDYYGISLPTVASQEELNAALETAAGQSSTIALASNLTVTLDNNALNGKNADVTIIGDGTQTFDVITNTVTAEGGQMNYQRGSSFTFKNLNIKAGEGDFDGVVCDELVFENCTITGKLTLFGKATFVNCVFENTMANQYSIWTWGGTDVKFDKCTFNTNGKAILLYGGATEANPTNLIVTNCTLNDRKNGAAGKAAIEIGNDYNATYNLTISGCVINGFAEGKNTGSKTWANKNSMDAAHLSVTIDDDKIQ